MPGVSLEVTMMGKEAWRRVVSTSSVKAFHVRPANIRYTFEDGFAMFAWRADWGLNGVSMAASPLHTLSDRRVMEKVDGAWVWEYRGEFQDGAQSHSMSEEEVQDRLGFSWTFSRRCG